MALLIDGHNLIGKTPWIDLGALDDEDELIRLLQEYARIRRKKIEVYFDQAPPGYSGKRNVGNVKAIFVASGSSADEAIHARLRSLGKSSPNWTVISSDHKVQGYAKAFRANVITAEAFVKELREVLGGKKQLEASTDRVLSEKELDDWMRLFKKGSEE